MVVKINRYCILLFTLMVLDLDCFYFVNRYSTYILGIGYTDLLVLIRILVVVYTIINNHGRVSKPAFFNVLLIGTVILSITSAFAGKMVYGQSIISGIIAQREWISAMLMVYPILMWLKNKQITLEQIIKTITIISVIYVCICTLQYFLIHKIVFLQTNINQRYGEARLRLSNVFLVVLSGFLIDSIMERRKHKGRTLSIFVLLGYIFLVAVITKGRMATLAGVGGIGVSVLLKKSSASKKIMNITVFLAAIIFLANSQLGKDALDVIFGSGTGISADTISVRNVETAYYLEMTTNSFWRTLLGCGYPSTSPIAQSLSSPTIGYWTYYTTDVGIVGNFYCYGFLGLFWFILVYSNILIKGYKIYKITNRTCYLQLFIIDVIGCISLWPLCFNFTIALPLIIAMLEYESEFIKQ